MVLGKVSLLREKKKKKKKKKKTNLSFGHSQEAWRSVSSNNNKPLGAERVNFFVLILPVGQVVISVIREKKKKKNKLNVDVKNRGLPPQLSSFSTTVLIVLENDAAHGRI